MYVSLQVAAEHRIRSALATFDDDDDDHSSELGNED